MLTLRVLIADDQQESAQEYASMALHRVGGRARTLERIQTEVAIALTVTEALTRLTVAAAAGMPFDVLVTDFFFEPDGSETAIDLIRQLRPMGFAPSGLDVILVSRITDIDSWKSEIAAVDWEWSGADSRGITRVFRDSSTHEDDFRTALYTHLWDRMERVARPAMPSLETGDEPSDIDDRTILPFRTADRELRQSIAELLSKAAPTSIPILILGENGSGKEVLARAVHRNSGRKRMVAVNLVALSRDLIESELFGHEKGAFTGAVAHRDGKIREADGGTLFLDEVGEIPLELQPKLLRVLQEKVITPVGGAREIRVDFRLLCATNRDLEEMVRSGRFREDLYYRIAKVTFRLTTLSERRMDIPFLAKYFWTHQTELPGRTEAWDPNALLALVERTWRGNVRELESFVDVLKVFAPHDEILTRSIIEKELTSQPVYVPGVRDLPNFTARQQHVILFPEADRVLRGSAARPDANRAIVDAVYASHSVLFGDTYDGAKEKILTAWNNHRRICKMCERLWESRWGSP